MDKKKRLMVGVLGATLLSTGGSFWRESEVLATSSCSTEEECQALIEEAKDELSQLEKETAEKEKDLTVVEESIEVLVTRIEETEAKIKQATAAIQVKEKEIRASEEELIRLQGEVSDLKVTVTTRMRLSQRMTRTNIVLNWISEATSLVDLIRSLQTINHFSQQDADRMDQLKEMVQAQNKLRLALKTQRESLAQTKTELEANQKQLENDQVALEKKREETKKEIQALESEKLSATDVLEIAQTQKALLEKLAAEEEARRQEEERRRQEEEEKKKQEEAMNNANNESSSSDSSDSSTDSNESANSSGESSSGSSTTENGIPVSSTFIIPLQSGYVSCEFMCYPNHTGIDLGNRGNTSTPVLATASGVVVRAGWHHAYGNHVILTHSINGQMITTVYAHMHTAPYVSGGDYVSQGQQLGTMGNTGNSQGAHLHFEMYEGYYNYPYAVNPRKYINFPSRW